MPKTVLVVEDDFDTQHPMAELLRLKGYNVVTASDAERALELARERRPDLIITDIVLPGKSGLHFISIVRSDIAIKDTPILVISGCGPMILVEAESAGADYCLEKPIHIEQFWAALGQVFADRADASAEAPSIRIKEKAQGSAGEIDRLVDQLRQSSSKDERDVVLKRLKKHILDLQARKTNCA